MNKKIVPEVLRFVSLIFQQLAKNCARYFQIRKHAFLIFENAMSKKFVPEIFRLVSMPFLIFEKAKSKKLCQKF